MPQDAYRDSSESLRTALATLRERADALANGIDRALLERVDPPRLQEIDRRCRDARMVAREPMSFDHLSIACDTYQKLIVYLEDIHMRAQDFYARDAYQAMSESRSHGKRRAALIAGALIIPLNFFVFMASLRVTPLFMALAGLQLVLGVVAFTAVFNARYHRSAGSTLGALGALVALGAAFGPVLALFASVGAALGSGGAWGRPLRLRGRVLHPELREGADWTRGERPNAEDLDAPTRAALEALWLHDAQKEHASVPALARVTWLLAAVGAPADLVEGVQVAAMEEIEHTRLCFALAAGYGGRSHTVEPMPDLVSGGLDVAGDPLERIAVESLNDGCLLEDFNADVAALCAASCRESATHGVLTRIAREERSHAELSWRLLAFALQRGAPSVTRAVERALAAIDRIPRPTAASARTRRLVEAANPDAMRAHGRIPDAEWADAWHARLASTKIRARALLSFRRAPEPSQELATTGV